MTKRDRHDLIEAVLSKPPFRLVYVAAGGGSRLAEWLYTTPGASRLMLNASLPYSPEALADHVPAGFTVERAVARETCEQMLESALARAMRYSNPMQPDKRVAALVVTAALATDRERRGADHAWYGFVGEGGRPLVEEVTFPHEWGRDGQETALSDALLLVLARAVGVAR